VSAAVRTLTDADVEAIAEALAKRLREVKPEPPPVKRRASPEMLEKVAKKMRRYPGAR
jgi:hypothetical protein